jgi:hypothetical protein
MRPNGQFFPPDDWGSVSADRSKNVTIFVDCDNGSRHAQPERLAKANNQYRHNFPKQNLKYGHVEIPS